MDATKKRDIRLCLLLVLILAVLYGACQNGQWVPGGSDDAYYLTIARNLITGRGYVWDDGPVVLATPCWPAVLAAVMWVSGSFAVLNLMLMAFCLAAAGVWYWLLRRFFPPSGAFVLALVTGVLFEWHRFTFTHYGEALFYLLVAVTLLLAFQIAENKRPGWRVGLLVLLCGVLVAVRYAALLLMPVIVCALLGGQGRPRLNRQWIAVVLACVVSVGAFVGIRGALRAHAGRKMAAATSPALQQKADGALELDTKRSRGVSRQSPKTYLRRARRTGEWVSLLLWPPAILGRTSKAAGLSVNLLGWAVVLLCALHLPAAVRKRQWIWAGVLFYVLLLPTLWGRPVARYYAPVAPLLLAGIYRGLEAVGGRRRPAAGRAAAVVFLASVAACNGAILAASAWVARSEDFQDICLAGEYGELLRIAAYLGRQAPGEGTVAVCVRYLDLNRRHPGFWAHRVLVFLTGRELRLAPRALLAEGETELAAWARSEGVRYLVTRPAHHVRRVWHFRLPLTNADQADRTTPFYVLREVRGEQMAVVELPAISGGLKNVPGL